MLKRLIIFLVFFSSVTAYTQTPKTYTSSEILLQLKKLNTLGAVLYIAAHPDDENTRLLAYLANEKLYRTGYLSLTRGDGGQNLIGDEQGTDLGLIRTQELLAARRIDGAEQFFSRAFDFGFCKTSDEALKTWGHDKILSDVVWVIRKFKPDVIITRFPPDTRAGHGHHAASAILAHEAFDAAANPAMFPEQLKQGVTVWQAKRLLWNTFNFGGANTQSEDQYKLDVGGYNPLLGKSYGEMAALGRSQHKSQGFGVPAQRGVAVEYFSTTKGDKPVNDLMEGVNTSWSRIADDHLPELQAKMIQQETAAIINSFSDEKPQNSVAALVNLYKHVNGMNDAYWKAEKLKEIKEMIEACSGLFIDATTNNQFAVQGDSIKFNILVNNRTGADVKNVEVNIDGNWLPVGELKPNDNNINNYTGYINPAYPLTQPYWLEAPMDKGSFNVKDQQMIGMAENKPLSVTFKMTINNEPFTFEKPLRYRYTDPVKGELYQPVSVIPAADLKFEKDIYLFKNKDSMYVDLELTPNIDLKNGNNIKTIIADKSGNNDVTKKMPVGSLVKDKTVTFKIDLPKNSNTLTNAIIHDSLVNDANSLVGSGTYKRVISYDHIPTIVYQKEATTKSVLLDFKIAGKTVGYIAGAGDKVPQALEEMGYKVVMLNEADIRANNLKQFDAIVTGVRAYNTNEWMNHVYDALMDYVYNGGVLLSQYNTSNQLGPVKAKMSPYPFTITRNRVTDEEATVNFLLPQHPALNYPNKITQKDFEGWIQERSIYNAEKVDSNYQEILSMRDAGENEQQGSLIIGNYGKGRFVYTGLVFFRELPAGVPGAYRLFANLIATPAKPAPKALGTAAKKTTFKPTKVD